MRREVFPGFTDGRFAGRHSQLSFPISLVKPFSSQTWSPKVIPSTPLFLKLVAILVLIPDPPAAFSPFAMMKSSPWSRRRGRSCSITKFLPGRPTMSPRKAIFMVFSLVNPDLPGMLVSSFFQALTQTRSSNKAKE